MTPYIQVIRGGCGCAGCGKNTIFDWNTPGAFQKDLERLAPAYKLRFALDQTIAVSYLMWLYGAEADAFVCAYGDWLKDFIFKHLAKFENDAFSDAVTRKLYQAAKNITSCWYSNDWVDVPASDIITYVYKSQSGVDEVAPYALSVAMAAPYLMFRNSLTGSEDYAGPVEVPYYRMESYSGPVMYINGSTIGTGFSKDYPAETIESKSFAMLMSEANRANAPILKFLTRVTLTNVDCFEKVLKFIADRRLSCDPTTVCNGNSKLFYATYTVLNDLYDVDFLDVFKKNGYLRSVRRADFEGIGQTLLSLLVYLNERYGTVATSRDLFIRFFGSKIISGKNEALNRAIRFAATNGTCACCADDREAVESLGISCEAMKLIISDSQNTTIPAEVRGADETAKENEGDQGENLDLSDLPELDVAEPGLEAEEEADTTTDGDQTEGEGDSSSGDDNKDDNAAPKQDDTTSGDDNQGPDDPGGDSGSDPNNSNTQGSNTPEDIDASDDEGIVFEISPEGSETVDSVMAREELDKFISDILVNPPKQLSPQAVSALTTLQKNWVHILSVATIVGILGKLVELPEKFKNIKITHGDNS